jgi:hypothetical protein
MSRSSTAPMVALTMALINPVPRWIPSWGSNQLPKKAPRIPMIKVADESEAGSPHDLAGEPAGNEANKQYDQQAFTRHVHLVTSRFCPRESITKRLAAFCIKLTSRLRHGA